LADASGRVVIDVDNFTASQGLIIVGDANEDAAGFSVSAAGDVNHDGFDDIMVGAPLGDDAALNGGEAYVVFGGAFGASATPVTTTGTAAAEMLYGGLGNDSLTGGGGADVFRAGTGNDLITVANALFKSVDGGNGIDTLKFSFGGSVDLGNLD